MVVLDPLNIGSNIVTNEHGDRVNADPDSRDAVCYNEATRDVIFLLQKREIHLDTINGVDVSDIHHDGDDLWINADNFDAEEIENAQDSGDFEGANDDHNFDAIRVSDQDLDDHGWALVTWRTESVWLRRPGAEAHAVSQRHNLGELGKDCRVYCVCAEGRLAEILKVVHCKEVEAYIHSEKFKTDYVAYQKGDQL